MATDAAPTTALDAAPVAVPDAPDVPAGSILGSWHPALLPSFFGTIPGLVVIAIVLIGLILLLRETSSEDPEADPKADPKADPEVTRLVDAVNA